MKETHFAPTTISIEEERRTIIKPRFCDLILLENCMLECRMCYMWQCRDTSNYIPAADYKQFITALNDYFGSDMQLQFVGGEPLLKPGIIDLIRCASQKGFFTSLTSNGYLINRKMACALMEGGLSSIALSLDSMEPGIHDFLRGRRGVYTRVKKALKYLADYKYPGQSICIVATIMQLNLDDLIPLAEWVEEHPDITCISFQVLTQPFYTKDDPYWYTDKRFQYLWPQDEEKLNRTLNGLIVRKQRKYKIANSVDQLELFKYYFRQPNLLVKKNGCHLGYNSLSVNAKGDIYLCFSQPPIGNIRRDRIQDVWESPVAQDVRRRIKICSQNCKLMLNCFSEEGFSIS